MPNAPRVLPMTGTKKRPTASSSARGYDSHHRRQRSRILDERPLCQHCNNAFSTDLHHIDGNPFNHSDTNVMAVCEDCHHNRIHGQDRL